MRYRAAAVVLALAAAVAIGQVPMYSDYPWGLLNNGADQGPVWNLDCKPPLWCSVPTYGNGQVQLGDGGVLPITVLFAQDAGQALLAGFAAYAADAGLANRSARADFADDAGFAIFAGDAGRAYLSNFSDYASDAGYSQSAGLAGVATYALDAGLASKAAVADFARDAGSAANADVATYALDAGLSVAALWAGDAGFATTSSLSALATYALDAGLASKAAAADFARDAGSAANADFARDAGSAASADLATFALDAGRSVFAGFAADAGLSVAALYAGDAGLSVAALFAADAGNLQCTTCVDSTDIASAAVTTGKLAALSVTANKLDDGPSLSAYDEATVAGVFSRSTATNCTKGTYDGSTGYIRFTVSTAVTNPQVSTTVYTGNTTNARTTLAVMRYRLSGGFTSSAPSTIRAINNANVAQTADAPGVVADGAWHTATFDISAWTTVGTLRVDLLMPSTLATTGNWDVSYFGTGIAASGSGALVSYQGRVGINEPTPSATLFVAAPATTAPSLTWNASAGQTLRNENSELAIGLSSASPFPLYFQGRTSTSTSRNISFQPLGGNVGVGDTAPDAVFKTNTINGGFVGMFQSSSSASAAFPELSVRNYSAGGGFPVIATYMARGTSASPSSPSSGDSLGAWVAYGRTLSSFTEGGRIQWTTTAAPGTSTLTTALDFYTSNNAASAIKARLDGAGYLGLGTTTIPAQVTVYGAGQTTGTFATAGNLGGAVYLRDSGSSAGNGGALMFGANQGAFAVIKGLLSDGATNTKGDVEFSLRTNAADATLTNRLKLFANGDVRVSTLAGVGNRAVYSDADGDLTNTSSDGTLKMDVEDLRAPLRMVLNLRPVTFRWKDAARFGPQRELGFIAQEVMQSIPEVVGRNADGTYTVDYPKIVAALAGAVQELYEDRTWLARRVQELEDRAQQQEYKLAQLEARLLSLENYSGIKGCGNCPQTDDGENPK
jgi:hypothetical protein